MEPTRICNIIESAVESVRSLLDERRHQLNIDIRDRELQVQADETRLTQALSQLLSNAAHFTEPGGTIRVTARGIGARILIEVSDTGIGMHASKLSSIADLLSLATPVSEAALDGPGLPIASGLIQQQGGILTVFSAGIGQGSRFEINLPMLAGLQSTTQDKTLKSPPTPVTDNKTACRALIVDDNQDAADMLSIALTTLGHTTQVAYEGHSALDLIEAFKPDVAVLDIGLPGMDGHELGRRIRTIPGLEQIFLVALTGYGLERDRDLALQAGFDTHLVKPVDIHDLDRLLRERATARSA